MKTELAVESYDNRSSEECKFGFVYFTDGTRVLYRTVDGQNEIHGANWGPTYQRHHDLARKTLVAEGVWKGEHSNV